LSRIAVTTATLGVSAPKADEMPGAALALKRTAIAIVAIGFVVRMEVPL
jgi:hypothetical protein